MPPVAMDHAISTFVVQPPQPTEGNQWMARRRSSNNSGVGCLVLLGIALVGGVANATGCGGKPSPSSTFNPPVGGYSTYTAPTDNYVAPSLGQQQPALQKHVSTDNTAATDVDVNVPNPSVPDVVPGDTAICRDGHVYHGQHRGACSHHHGVAQWLSLPPRTT